jgi:hypothetical protein
MRESERARERQSDRGREGDSERGRQREREKARFRERERERESFFCFAFKVKGSCRLVASLVGVASMCWVCQTFIGMVRGDYYHDGYLSGPRAFEPAGPLKHRRFDSNGIYLRTPTPAPCVLAELVADLTTIAALALSSGGIPAVTLKDQGLPRLNRGAEAQSDSTTTYLRPLLLRARRRR